MRGVSYEVIGGRCIRKPMIWVGRKKGIGGIVSRDGGWRRGLVHLIKMVIADKSYVTNFMTDLT